jgi:hypothetical protein
LRYLLGLRPAFFSFSGFQGTAFTRLVTAAALFARRNFQQGIKGTKSYQRSQKRNKSDCAPPRMGYDTGKNDRYSDNYTDFFVSLPYILFHRFFLKGEPASAARNRRLPHKITISFFDKQSSAYNYFSQYGV